MTTTNEHDQTWYFEEWEGKPGMMTGVPDLNKIALVASYMYDHGDADQIAYMIEKPWKFADEYAAALDEQG